MSPSSFSAMQRARIRYVVKEDYKAFVSDLRTILESTDGQDARFFLDLLFDIPQVADKIADKPDMEDDSVGSDSDDGGNPRSMYESDYSLL